VLTTPLLTRRSLAAVTDWMNAPAATSAGNRA